MLTWAKINLKETMIGDTARTFQYKLKSTITSNIRGNVEPLFCKQQGRAENKHNKETLLNFYHKKDSYVFLRTLVYFHSYLRKFYFLRLFEEIIKLY